METKQSFWKKYGLAVFFAVVWELLEEMLEELIAFGITSFIVKTLSTTIVVLATIGIKRLLFRLLKPIVKKFTYKKGEQSNEQL